MRAGSPALIGVGLALPVFVFLLVHAFAPVVTAFADLVSLLAVAL